MENLINHEATLKTASEFWHALNQIMLDYFKLFKDLNNPRNGIGTMERL